MVSFFGFLRSYPISLPLAFFFCCAASAEVMFDEVARTYSLAAVKSGFGVGASGYKAFWMDDGFLRTSSQMYSDQ